MTDATGDPNVGGASWESPFLGIEGSQSGLDTDVGQLGMWQNSNYDADPNEVSAISPQQSGVTKAEQEKVTSLSDVGEKTKPEEQFFAGGTIDARKRGSKMKGYK